MADRCVSIQVSISREDVLHFLGYPKGKPPAERVAGMLEETLAEARSLARARGAFAELPVSSAAEVGLEAIEADGLVIGLVTAGGGIEERVAEMMSVGDMTRALLLDAAGSAAAEEAANRLSALISGDEGGDTSDVSCRISPGYGRWALTSQTDLFARLPHAELGVSLLPSMLMVPRKSISFAMWMGAEARPITGLSGCTTCGLEHCRYRRQPAVRRSSEVAP